MSAPNTRKDRLWRDEFNYLCLKRMRGGNERTLTGWWFVCFASAMEVVSLAVWQTNGYIGILWEYLFQMFFFSLHANFGVSLVKSLKPWWLDVISPSFCLVFHSTQWGAFQDYFNDNHICECLAPVNRSCLLEPRLPQVSYASNGKSVKFKGPHWTDYTIITPFSAALQIRTETYLGVRSAWVMQTFPSLSLPFVILGSTSAS